jgi:hypothetical protein
MTTTKRKTKTKTKRDCNYHTVILVKHYADYDDVETYYGKIICISCGKVIKWLDRKEYYKIV